MVLRIMDGYLFLNWFYLDPLYNYAFDNLLSCVILHVFADLRIHMPFSCLYLGLMIMYTSHQSFTLSFSEFSTLIHLSLVLFRVSNVTCLCVTLTGAVR